jgi:hypothetical protein
LASIASPNSSGGRPGTALTGPLARRRQASNSAGHSTGESVRAAGSSSFSIGRPPASTSTKYTDLMTPPIVESACARAYASESTDAAFPENSSGSARNAM